MWTCKVPDFNHCDHRRTSQQWRTQPAPIAGWHYIINQASGLCLQQGLLVDYKYCGIGSVLVQSWRGHSNRNARAKGSCLGTLLAPCNLADGNAAGQLWAFHEPANKATAESLLEYPKHSNPNVFQTAT